MADAVKNEVKTDRWISDIVGALTDPIICHGNQLDSPPDKIRTAITLQRLIENITALKEKRQPTGTDAEAAWYLSTASLAAPLPAEWVRIYMYVFNKTCKTTQTEVPEDLHQDTLDNYEMGLLNDLKRWIYKVRTEHRKEADRAGKREQRDQVKKDKEYLQPKMFEF